MVYQGDKGMTKLKEYYYRKPNIYLGIKINSTHLTTLSFKINYKCTLRRFNLTHVFLIDGDHIFIDEGLTPCLIDHMFVYCERGLKR